MSDSILRNKKRLCQGYSFFLCRRVKLNGDAGGLINQLFRSGTSVGANVHKTQYAQGAELEIALKECNESEYLLICFAKQKCKL